MAEGCGDFILPEQGGAGFLLDVAAVVHGVWSGLGGEGLVGLSGEVEWGGVLVDGSGFAL